MRGMSVQDVWLVRGWLGRRVRLREMLKGCGERGDVFLWMR